jgi:long-subunit acyl-CoA synthetase (AMP-forming)
MRGYCRAPELTAMAIDTDGWFNTGDLARFDGNCLYIVGRSKEMIIRSGFKSIRRKSRPSSIHMQRWSKMIARGSPAQVRRRRS